MPYVPPLRSFSELSTTEEDFEVIVVPGWPSIRYYALMLVIGPLWYLFFIGGGLYLMTGRFSWRLIVPAAVMTVAWTIRGAVKLRERSALQVGWPEPVGRQTAAGLAVLVTVCGTLGIIAGWLLAQVPIVQATGIPAATWMIVVGAWEVIQTIRRIPAASED
jgi:hypothetical protein